MEYSDIPGVFDLVHLVAAHGIRHAVISPGSRNAPISISLNRHPEIKTYVIPDERVAGFFALGLAQQLRQPVMMCCTSGSAALNYAPAIAEAFYQRIPLLVVTADRPEEWIDQGDGQTIRQKNVFQNYVRFSTGIIQNAVGDSDRNANRKRISEAIEKTSTPVGGPVHLNFPLDEPLYNTRSYESTEYPSAPEKIPDAEKIQYDVSSLQEDLKSAKKILMLCAMAEPNPELESVLGKWSEADQVVVLTETISNLNHEKFFPCIDRLITTFDESDLVNFQPDLLITFGHQIISKKIKAILRQRKPRLHWHIDPDTPHPNTFQALTRSIISDPLSVLTDLLPALPNIESGYQHWIRQRDQSIDSAHQEYMLTCPFSDLKATEILLNHLPKHYNFHIGNSASVRYAQLFKQGRVLHCNSNRGTSGIDGCTSTAMGAASATGQPTLLLTGDMAFLYDSNAFWHPHVPGNLKIVVLNNAGGGIFRIIDGPEKEAETERFFEAHHQQTAGRLAKMYDLPYFAAHNETDVKTGIQELLSSPNEKPAILEIFTPRLENDKILKRYFGHLQTERIQQNPIKHA